MKWPQSSVFIMVVDCDVNHFTSNIIWFSFFKTLSKLFTYNFHGHKNCQLTESLQVKKSSQSSTLAIIMPRTATYLAWIWRWYFLKKTAVARRKHLSTTSNLALWCHFDRQRSRFQQRRTLTIAETLGRVAQASAMWCCLLSTCRVEQWTTANELTTIRRQWWSFPTCRRTHPGSRVSIWPHMTESINFLFFFKFCYSCTTKCDVRKGTKTLSH